MARLNKKVAITGLVFLTLMVVGGLFVLQKIRKDPAEFISAGEAELESLNALIKEYESKSDYSDEAVEAVKAGYKEVLRNYGSAKNVTKDNDQRVDMLFILADIHAMDNKFHSPNWEKIVACWGGIVTADPKNVDARLKLLDYFYEWQLSIMDLIPSGDPSLWVKIEKEASELIDVMEEKDLPASAHVLKARARATLGMSSMEKKPEEFIDRAVKQFEKLLEIAPEDAEIYKLLGQAYIMQGEQGRIRSVPQAMEKAEAKRDEIIELGVKNASDKAAAKVSFLNLRYSKTISAAIPLKSLLDQCLRYMRNVKYVEDSLAASKDRDTQNNRNELNKLKAAVTKGKRQIQQELVALSAEHPLLSGIQDRLGVLFGISDPQEFRAEGKKFIREVDSKILKPFKDEFNALSREYPSSAQIHAALSHVLTISDSSNHDAAIDEMSKAIELDKQNPGYSFSKANLLYKKSMVEGDIDALEEGIKIMENALKFPDVSVEAGPRSSAAKMFRRNFYEHLAKCHIERAVFARAAGDDVQVERSTANAEDAIHHIRQFEKADKFIEAKWDGLLAMVKGEKILAISNLHYAQKLLKSTEKVDPLVSYYLSKLLSGRSEIGSRAEFLTDALLNKFGSDNYASIASTKPEALLDYSEVLIQMNRFMVARDDVAIVYEEMYGSTERSNSIIVLCDIALRDFDQAEKRLSKMDPESSQTVTLQLNLLSTRISYIDLQLSALEQGADDPDGSKAESLKRDLKRLKAKRFELVRKRTKMGADDGFVFPASIFVQLLKDGEKAKASELADAYIAASENNTEALYYKAILAEADPLNVPQKRQFEIREQVYKGTSDELKRHILLGGFYYSAQEFDKSVSEFKSALKTDPDNADAISGFFDASLSLEDFAGAASIVESARKNNVDYCGGEFFAARIDVANKNYDSAIKRIDECLEKRPIFSGAYILKSRIYTERGEHEEAVKNARTAARINSMDGNVAKQVAAAIQTRNIALKNKLTDDQHAELTEALKRSIVLNQNEPNLRVLYARHIYGTNPTESIAVMQDLVKTYPTKDYFLLLGEFARDLAVRKVKKTEKKFYFDIAEPGFEQAFKLAQQDKAVVDAYCDFLRLTDRHDQALKILEDRNDLLWVYHLRDGQFEKAKATLVELYQTAPEDIQVLRGLMKACKETGDKDGLKKYSEELIVADNSVDNQLLQIQMYLDSGLVSEAGDLLSAFRARYPDEQRGLLLEAWSTMSKGKLDTALKLVDKYLASEPENPIAWRLRGQIHSTGGDYDKAIQDLIKSRNIEDNSTIKIELAKVYSKSGRINDAIGVLSSALDDDRAPMRMLVMLEELYVQSGRKSDLPGFYRKTLEKYPENINWHFRAGRYSLIEGKFADAKKYFRRALDLGKGTRNTYVILDGYLTAMRSLTEYQKAIDFASKYIDTEYAPIAYLNMANSHEKLDDRKKSLKYFHKAIEASGDNSLYVLKILSNMSNVIGAEEVIKWCNKELARDPNSFAANRMMSMIMAEKEQYTESIDYIDNCLKGFKADSGKYLEILALKANTAVAAYMKTGGENYLDVAIKTNTHILSENPHNPGILNNLSYFYAKTGTNIDKAVEYGRKAHKINPNDANVMDTYAFALCKAGKYKEAKELIHSAIGIIETDSIKLPWDLVKHLGMAHEGLSEIEEARNNYKKALELAGDDISPKDREDLIAAVARVSK